MAGAVEGMGLVRDKGRPFSPLRAVEESNFSFAVLGMLGRLGSYFKQVPLMKEILFN